MTATDHRLAPGIGPATITAAALQRRLGVEPGFGQPLRAGQAVLADRGVLVILQAVNAGGKDGTISEIASVLGVSRVRVERFRRRPAGTTVEDTLERALAAGPCLGELVFFHRSHYEELLRAVLENDADAHRIRGAIVELESAFDTRATVVLKLFLHIDRDEQLVRLDRRRDQPDLVSLHNPDDYRDQRHWDDLMDAYQTVLTRTHTLAHPWMVIPANDRTVRNALVASLLRPHLEP